MRVFITMSAALALLLTGCTTAPESTTPLAAELPESTISRTDTTPASTQASEEVQDRVPEETPEDNSESSLPDEMEPISSGTSDSSSSSAPSNQTEASTSIPVAPNATISTYIEQMGLSADAEILFLQTEPKIVSSSELLSECSDALTEPGAGLLGCYTSWPSRIFLYDITDGRVSDAEPVVAAHEFLHAVWYQELTSAERTSLTNQLQDYFDSLPAEHYLRSRLEGYINSNPASVPTELHSILGSEAKSLPAALEAHYAQYFNNRQTLVKLAEASFGKIYDLSLELNAESERLKILGGEINSDRETLSATENQLDIDIATFNAAVEEGAYSKSEYDEARASLVSRQDALKASYAAFNEKVDGYNAAINAYNVRVGQARSMSAALNIPQD